MQLETVLLKLMNLVLGVVKERCTAPVNITKFKINYSCFFRDVKKTESILNVY